MDFKKPKKRAVLLPVGLVRDQLLDVVQQVAVGDEHVEPAIEVGVEEHGSEADVEHARAAEAGTERSVFEARVSLQVERIRLVAEVGDEQIDVAVVVDVTRVHAHTRLGPAVGVVTNR